QTPYHAVPSAPVSPIASQLGRSAGRRRMASMHHASRKLSPLRRNSPAAPTAPGRKLRSRADQRRTSNAHDSCTEAPPFRRKHPLSGTRSPASRRGSSHVSSLVTHRPDAMTARPTTVLITSDREWSSRSLESILGPHGFTVLKTSNVEQTLERVAASRPDAVIL